MTVLVLNFRFLKGTMLLGKEILTINPISQK
jgi:hypothetical protein